MNNSLPSLSITMKMYGWTKWGGGRMGMSKECLDEWYCQVCGEKQTKTLPSYMFPLDDSGIYRCRVCADCKARARISKVTRYWELIRIVKGI